MNSAKHLEMVRVLAEHRNFSRPAAALGVSQPSLTRSLMHLEEALGVAPFNRDGAEPTIFGEIVLWRGRSVRARSKELTRRIALMERLDAGGLSVALCFYPAGASGHEAAATEATGPREQPRRFANRGPRDRSGPRTRRPPCIRRKRCATFRK